MATDKFDLFAKAVRAQFKEMSESTLLVTDTDRDAIWLSNRLLIYRRKPKRVRFPPRSPSIPTGLTTLWSE